MEDKVQAVQDWPTPTNTRQLKSFLRLGSFYRRLLRGFSCVASCVLFATSNTTSAACPHCKD